MRIVKDESFLHIHRIGEHSDKWHVDSTISFGSSLNSFVGVYETINLNINGYEPLELLRHIVCVKENNCNVDPEVQKKGLYNDQLIIEKSYSILNEYVLFMREYVFEEVRKEYYLDYPTRFKGLWVMEDSTDTLKYWYTQLINKNQQYKVFRVSLTGKIHEASQEHLEVKTYNLNQWRELAHNYWKGVSTRERVETEAIFEGDVLITEELHLDNVGNVISK